MDFRVLGTESSHFIAAAGGEIPVELRKKGQGRGGISFDGFISLS
jgi:hypothetical protein